MPWSAGTFSRTDGTRTGSTVWQQAKAAAIKIVASDHDTHDQDMANGINASLHKGGQNQPTANINWGGFQVTNFGGAQHKTGGASYTGSASHSGENNFSGAVNFTGAVTFGTGAAFTASGTATFENEAIFNDAVTFGAAVTNNAAWTFNGTATFAEIVFSGSAADVSGLLANVVEDTTPQLGGDLDGQGNNVENYGTKVIERTNDFTASAADAGATYLVNKSTNVTVTLPNSLVVGWHASFMQYASGAAVFAAATGASVLHPDSDDRTSGQYAQAALTVIKNTGGSAAEIGLVGGTTQ